MVIPKVLYACSKNFLLTCRVKNNADDLVRLIEYNDTRIFVQLDGYKKTASGALCRPPIFEFERAVKIAPSQKTIAEMSKTGDNPAMARSE
jgi:hypothetical protein